jgi:hypothetical protein
MSRSADALHASGLIPLQQPFQHLRAIPIFLPAHMAGDVEQIRTAGTNNIPDGIRTATLVVGTTLTPSCNLPDVKTAHHID